MNFEQIACDQACRFTVTGQQTTCMGWTPAYDKFGRVTNKDPNTRTAKVDCLVCDRQWRMTERQGVAEFTEC